MPRLSKPSKLVRKNCILSEKQTKIWNHVHSLNTLISPLWSFLFFTAQQDAERAKYIVIGAAQEKKTIITKARGEAESAELIGTAVKKNPGFMKLRRIDAAREIADIVAASGNKVYLNADSLLLNLVADPDDKAEKSASTRRWGWTVGKSQ